MEKANFFKVNELKAKKVLEDSTLRVVTNKNTMVTILCPNINIHMNKLRW
jgi:hypothetical protein